MKEDSILATLRSRRNWFEGYGIVGVSLIPGVATGAGPVMRIGLGLAYKAAPGVTILSEQRARMENELRNQLGLRIVMVEDSASGDPATIWKREAVF